MSKISNILAGLYNYKGNKDFSFDKDGNAIPNSEWAKSIFIEKPFYGTDSKKDVITYTNSGNPCYMDNIVSAFNFDRQLLGSIEEAKYKEDI